MLTIILVLVVAAAITLFLVKKSKTVDTNSNNIPEALEHIAVEVKEEVKETVAKVKKTTAKKKATKK